MECPKCSYEPTMAEQSDSPDICPSCGVVYSKVRAQQANKPGVHYGAPVLEQMARQASNARPVAGSGREPARVQSNTSGSVEVTNVRIPFLSLVWLMTKIILASLPAALLAVIIVVAIFSFMGGLLTA